LSPLVATRLDTLPVTAHSTPGTPEYRYRQFPTASPDNPPVIREKTRHGSISLHHAVSLSSFHARSPSVFTTTPAATLVSNGNDAFQAGVTQGRVKAKVSAITQQVESSTNSLSPPPVVRSVQPRVRAPSISSSVSLDGTPSSPPNPVFYPITTATAAANPHRFATTRASPPATRYHYQPFSPNDDPPTNSRGRSIVAKVDATAIPMPLHSPPTSAVSLSSRSSVSQSSPSYNTGTSTDSRGSFHTLPSPKDEPDCHGRNIGLPNIDERAMREVHKFWGQTQKGLDTDDDQSNEDRKVKAEAKSNRKVSSFLIQDMLFVG
jgi:hypothetical protein